MSPTSTSETAPGASQTEAEIAASRALWTYKHAFVVAGLAGEVVMRSTMKGMGSTLFLGGVPVATDATPPAGPGSSRNHRLAATLADGRQVTIEAGFIDWARTAIAVAVDDVVVHESHPGKTIALPERAAKMMEAADPAKGGANADIDFDAIKRNKLPIAVDITLGLIFYIVAKLTNLNTAAIGGAVVGLILYAIQRRTGKDLLGGMAVFGIIMSLIAVALALAFQNDDAVKWRSTVMGLIGATVFLVDGAFGGKKVGAGMARYMPYRDIDPRRLAIGMGIIGLIMASLNVVATRLLTTDGWLFYTTFLDFPLVMVMAIFMTNWARKGRRKAEAAL